MSFLIPLLHLYHEEDYNKIVNYLKTHDSTNVEKACKICNVDINDFSKNEIVTLKSFCK